MNTTQQDTETNIVRRSGRFIFGLLLALILAQGTQAASLDLNNYNTLNEMVSAIKNNMPDEDSEQYTIPSQQVQNDINQVVTNILNGQDPQTINLPASLQNHYTLAEFVDNGQTYVVLAETVDNDNNGVADRGWATIIINNANYAQTLSIDIPHPLNDSGTPEQGIAIFKGTNARTFVMSGAHRNANDILAPCFNDPNYKIADAAHNTAHTFHAAVEAIDQYYDNQLQAHTAFQFHGMGEESSNGLDVYMTHGTKRVPLINSVVDQIKTDLNSSQPTWDVAVPGDQTEADLNGIGNLQGRLLNDVHPNAICEVRAYSYTGQFVHVEQISDAREANAYGSWVQALNNINFNMVPAPPGYWITSPNGGETWDLGADVVITWESVNIPGQVKVSLHKNGNYHRTINNSTENDGEYTWNVPMNIDPDSDYTVRVRSVDNTSIKDYSDANFTVQTEGQPLTAIDNYPNPFNPETVIRYQLPNATHVELIVFNMIGQQIAHLVNQTQNAGYHAIHFDARHLASGQYIYQIRANNQVSTGRMLLIK